MHIVAVIGSLRRGSFNRMTYHAVEELLPEGVTLSEASIEDIPPYNDDVRLEHGYPPPVQALRDKLFAADAILFISPEYNYSIPGVLKNAIDWASRPVDDQPFRNKPVGVMGASTGAMGTSRMQSHLRQAMVLVEGLVMTRPEVVITFAAAKFDVESGRLIDEPTREVIRHWLEAFVAWVERVRE
jgi:chromate reductase, NAD(P)H dehydrogenase (quinone)